MAYTLPPLPYPLDALHPVISAEALELHHGVHHQGYVDKLNAALAEHGLKTNEPIEELVARVDSLPDRLQKPVRNFGGGHANHSLMWETMTPDPHPPSTHLDKLIARDFGSVKALRKSLENAAAGLFGSGWVFLTWDPTKGELELDALPNQDSPVGQGLRPLLPCDLWEHAHYVDYRNRRDEWVRDWWNLVDWRQVEKRLDAPRVAVKGAM